MKKQIKAIVLFSIIFTTTFIPELLPSLFGDTYCFGSGKPINVNDYSNHYLNCDLGGFHHATWHWGWRHWIFIIFGLIMTIWSIINIVESKEK